MGRIIEFPLPTRANSKGQGQVDNNAPHMVSIDEVDREMKKRGLPEHIRRGFISWLRHRTSDLPTKAEIREKFRELLEG